MAISVKNGKLHRVLSVVLSIVMIVSMLPTSVLTAFAAQTELYSFIVTNGSGFIEEANVTISADGEEISSGTTDEQGRVEFELESKDEYEYSVEKIGYEVEKGTFGVDDKEITVTLTEKEVCIVTGKVIDSNSGEPLANADIAIKGYSEYSTVSGEDGTFSVPNVYRDENYTISATAATYVVKEQALLLDEENVIQLESKAADEFAFEEKELNLKFGQTNIINTAYGEFGYADEYKSDAEDVVSVDNNGNITIKGLGSATITAVRYETETQLEMTAQCTVNVTKGTLEDLVWEYSVQTGLTWKDTFTNTIKDDGVDGVITYSSSNDRIATVDENGKVTALRPGTVTITATKKSENYEDKAATYEITFDKAQKEISFEKSEDSFTMKYGSAFANKIKDEKAVTYSVDKTDIATVDANGKITALKQGTVTVTAIVAEDEFYKEATASYKLNVERADQTGFAFENGNDDKTITYSSETTVTFKNSAINNQTAVTYSVDKTDIATVDKDGIVSVVKPGEVIITATCSESEQYNGADISYKLIIEKSKQTVNFESTVIPTLTFGEGYTNTATAKSKIEYSSSDKSIATVDKNGKLTILKAGTVTITATAIEDDYFNEATNSYTITINKAIPEIEFENGADVEIKFNDNKNKYTNAALSNSENCVYSIDSGSAFADIDAKTGELTIKGAGTIVVKAFFAENDCYIENEATYKLTISKSEQTIAFESNNYSIVRGQEFVSPKAETIGDLFGTGSITYAIKPDTDTNGIIKSINANTGEIEFNNNKVGEAVVIATKAADVNYNKATAEYKITVSQWSIDEADAAKYFTVEGSKNGEWFNAKNISIVAKDGYELGDSFDGEWSKTLDTTNEDGVTTISVYVKDLNNDKGKISNEVNVELSVDTVAPNVEIVTKEYSAWDKFLTIISLGLWENSNDDFIIKSSDKTSGIETSGVAKVEYYIDFGSTVAIPEFELKEKLDKITEWTAFENAIPMSKDEKFVIYAKVTDVAGNYQYASTNGIVFDATAPEVNITLPENANSFGYFNSDVLVDASISDAEPTSGIASVEYWVECDGDKTQGEELYKFENENPLYEELTGEWNTKDNDKTIVVDSAKNNSDNVEVFVKAVDNAGNETEKSIKLKINETAPELKLTYDVNDVNEIDGRGYFASERIATLKITDRATTLNKDGLSVKVKANGAEIDSSKLIKWLPPVDNVHTALIPFSEEANYDVEIAYTNKADMSNEGIDTSENASTPYTFTVDKTAPTGSIIADTETWTELLKVLTFGLFSNEAVEIKATIEDQTSPAKIEYFKTNDIQLKTFEELDMATDWLPYDSTTVVFVEPNEKCVVYVKLTDAAGNYSYICSKGCIADNVAPEVNITLPENANSFGYFNSDVLVDASISDAEPHSGIASVEYWVECDGKKTQGEELYKFENENPLYEELTGEWNTKDNDKTIVVDSAKNNSDNVEVFVKAVDNAGNETEKSIKLKINETAPELKLTYDVNDVNEIDGRGYFASERIATLKITDRATTLNKDGLSVKVKANGAEIDSSKLIKWLPPVDNVHTALIPFSEEANYDVEIAYTNKADMSNEGIDTSENASTPYTFTVDKTAPTGSVTAAPETWTELLEILTFGLFSNKSVDVSATIEDQTSPATIEYCKTSDTKPKTAEELDDITDWVSYAPNTVVSVEPNEKFVVYVKLTDAAGNYSYICTNGYVVDDVAPEITLTPDETTIKHNDIGVYNEDVKVDVSVTDAEPHSGIASVEYWVECDGKETQREELYKFENENPLYEELTDEWNSVDNNKTIIVDSEKNNSCNVEVFVKVIDNAGNENTKSVKLDIDVSAPEIKVTYYNNNPYKITGENGYFATARTATVEITERTGHFSEENAYNGIEITAKDVNGKTLLDEKGEPIKDAKGERIYDDNGKLINPKAIMSAWSTTESKEDSNKAVHKMTIDYSVDANYTFAMSYTDLAENPNKTPINFAGSVTPASFTVDKTIPTGSITVGKLGTWDKLIETLTFGLWSRDAVDVTVKYDDKTSGIESVSYIKADDKVARTVTELQNSEDWIPYESFEVNPNERFVIYVRIVDNSGNTKYISTDGIIVDNENPIIEDVKPEITIVPEQPVNGIYNTDVNVAVKVEEPVGGYTEAYSGIKEIKYEVLNMGNRTQEGTLFDFAESMKGEPITQDKLVKVWEKTDAIVVDKKLNNSNDVVINVYAVDNAGNQNELGVSIKIDITNPTIDVTYDNNDGDTAFSNGVYFKKNRKATIVITERNFDAEKVNVTIENEHGEVPAISNWTTVNADGNGDKTTHTATILYSADGDYKFNISYADEAGNKNDAVNYGESLAPTKFTIDKTRPLVTVAYDNNEVLNGNYYKAARTATVTVVEHNFETSRVKFNIKATDNGNPSALPAISGWTTNGDVHTATISYIADSHYTFDFDYTDKAGNETADIAEQDFYIDKTNPFVSITKIVDNSANNSKGKIGFVVTATDTNFDLFETVLTAIVKDGNGFKTQRVNIGKTTDITNGKIYTVDNIDFDGIYTIKCTVVDKAGNAFSEVSLQRADGSTYVEKHTANDTLVEFSVNRDGSTYKIDENTSNIVDKYYVKNVNNDIVVVEINADPLKEYKVMLNGVELKENSDYTVSQSGGNGSWMKYTYTISKALFANEGEYKVVVLSKDKADNDAFSDVKNVALNFVVDRTAPVVTITGMENGGRYQTDKQLVTLIPTDDGGALNSLIVRLVSDNGDVLKELVNLSGDDLQKALEEGGGKISFEIEEGMYQNIQVICDDCAFDGSGTSNVYNETFKEVSVSTNAFAIFFASRTVRYVSIAVVVAITALIILLVIFKKRKKDKKEDKKS